MERGRPTTRRRPGRRGAALACLGLLAGLLGCGTEPAARPAAPRQRAAASRASRQVASAPDPRVAACVERGARGPGYDELSPRDTRRKLRRLQLQRECEAHPDP